MKKILGLDLGTNSIGWALIDQDFEKKEGCILGMGSRIIPMDQATLGEFERGNTVSQTKERTGFRGVRRLRERHLLRRARLHMVLNVLGFLPEHYANAIDFDHHFGQFKDESEPKLVYRPNSENGKAEFIFHDSFQEMMRDFRTIHPDLVKDNLKVPYDWTIYYLRKKAISERIGKQELAWLLLNFNQKRGYYQLRGEEIEESENKSVEFHALRVVDVTDSGDRKGKDDIWYNVTLENGWIYRRTSKTPLDWVGKVKEFVVTTDLNEDGSVKKDKEGKEKRSFRAPLPDDWTLVKKRTEYEIEHSNTTVGCYIYNTLLENPSQKINGKLVRTVERKFYRDELKLILEKQSEFHPELQDKRLYTACVKALYVSNESHRNSLECKNFIHFFLNDIIYYQRPLKSKKSLIADCKYETRAYKGTDGSICSEPVKCIAKSHPLFQEFRLWQFLQNLRIYRKSSEVDGKIVSDLDVTSEFLKSEAEWVALFDWLNDRKEVKQETFLKYPPFNLKKRTAEFRWNYVEDKTYPANETRALMLARLDKVPEIPDGFLKRDVEEHLWHILYSVEDKLEIEKALNTFAGKYNLPEGFTEQFRRFPSFKKEYGAYSAKAIKKLLTLMRRGEHWDENKISPEVVARISSIQERLLSIGQYPLRIEEIVDDDIPKQVLKSFIHCNNPLQALNTYQACYAVYGRHSEEGEIVKWKDPAGIDDFLQNTFRQHELRNPVVEKVITETLRVVRDIWSHFGNGAENFFDEIHVELGREMKNPADKRKRMTEQISENENTNLRIKSLLAELSLDPEISNVRPYSPAQQEILRIYEEGVLNTGIELPDDILKISRNATPTKPELIRYKLWLEQKYRSPYTGEVIPLGRLFTPAYEIEHIIPQSRYFDDSLNNKVICEAEVNKDKDNSLGYEYIRDNSGKIMQLALGKTVKLFTLEAYQLFVKDHYSGNRGKMKRLLMDDIPEGFILRQLNDTRYISKVVKNLLSNIVREEGELETTSKRVAASNGTITSVLKQEWGLNDIWNELISPRFERLNQLTGSTRFGEWINREGKKVFQTRVPLELQKGFSKKRIDHRHHALDALVIACATRNHINYLNNGYAGSEKRYDLRSTLCFKDKTSGNGQYRWSYHKPWLTFSQDAKAKLGTIIVTFKQNNRVINKTVNRYQKWEQDESGQLKKVIVTQEKGDHWAIRKPMHKDTVAGAVSLKCKKVVPISVAIGQWTNIADKSLRKQVKLFIGDGKEIKDILKYFKSKGNIFNECDISKVEIWYTDNDNVATRVAVDDGFTSSVIANVTDSGIRKILLKHLAGYNEISNGNVTEHPELAFSPDGLDELNKNIRILNGGRDHKPILKVRKFEPRGNKFAVGYKGNKGSKFVEAAKGTNLYFAVYADANGRRSYESIPLNVVIERMKQGLGPVPEINDQGLSLLFSLSPNDLVYVPNNPDSSEEFTFVVPANSVTPGRVYKMVSSTGLSAFFIRHEVASVIINKNEFSPLNKMERSIEGVMIKEVCFKLKIDRLGQLS